MQDRNTEYMEFESEPPVQPTQEPQRPHPVGEYKIAITKDHYRRAGRTEETNAIALACSEVMGQPVRVYPHSRMGYTEGGHFTLPNMIQQLADEEEFSFPTTLYEW